MSSPTSNFRRSYERHLDLLLAEELSCNPAFARWFLEQAIANADLPPGVPSDVKVEVSRVEAFDDTRAAGEDDLFVVATWPDGRTAVVLVEDKLDAVLQHLQIERYLGRAEHERRRGHVAGVLVVAPEAYLEQRAEAFTAVCTLSIDSVAERLRQEASTAERQLARRLAWRADALVVLKEARRSRAEGHEPTIALREWIVQRLTVLDPSVRPDGWTLRTINTTWLFFSPDVGLIFKIEKGWVDLYPQKILETYERGQPNPPKPADFEYAEDSSKNLVLRWSGMAGFEYQRLLDGERPPELESALEACCRASRWAELLRSAVSQ